MSLCIVIRADKRRLPRCIYRIFYLRVIKTARDETDGFQLRLPQDSVKNTIPCLKGRRDSGWYFGIVKVSVTKEKVNGYK